MPPRTSQQKPPAPAANGTAVLTPARPLRPAVPIRTLAVPKKLSAVERIRPMNLDGVVGYKVLLYGGPGSGKTTLWGTFPGQILCMLCSGGLQPDELLSLNTPELCAKVDQVAINESQDVDDLVRHAATSGRYSTVVLDHASGLQDIIIRELLNLDDLPVAKYRIAGKGESWSLVSQKQYGELKIRFMELLRPLLSLPIHVVIVAQERVFKAEDEESGDSDLIKPTVGAALTPSLAGWLNSACSYVVQMLKRPKMEPFTSTIQGKSTTSMRRVPGVTYCLRTEPHEVYQTKFRIPKGRPLPEVIEDPSFEKIDACIKGLPIPGAAPKPVLTSTAPARPKPVPKGVAKAPGE